MTVRHLALIPDGNRRWARSRGWTIEEGHSVGIENVGRIAEAAWARGVEVVTFWWGSPANLTLRPADEVRGILGVLAAWLYGPGSTLLARNGARFDAWGRIAEFCPSVWPAIESARAAGGPGPRRLVLLLAYDGRDEIAAAAEQAPTVLGITTHLWTASLPPVDLLVRTGGEPHLSAAFMAWSLAEACLFFPDELWPEWDVAGLDRALGDVSRRERRYGR